MLNRISSKLAEELLKRAGHVDYSCDVYVYGIEILISTLSEIAVILISASLFASFQEGAMFIILFFTLRVFSGGYHAKTYRRCFLVTFGTFLSIEAITDIMENMNCGRIIYSIFVLACIYIIVHAPVINRNQPLEQMKIIRNGKIASVITVLQMVMANKLFYYNQRMFYIASLTACFTAVFMLIADIENAEEGVSGQWD